MWRRLLKKSGFDERDKSTKYHRMHFHTLRKFFETRMSVAGVPEAIIQQLQGHTGYLNGSYKRYTDRELSEAYKKGMKDLLIFSRETKDVKEIRDQLAEKDKQIQELKDQMQMLMAKVLTHNDKEKKN
jgi:hypothetical protein